MENKEDPNQKKGVPVRKYQGVGRPPIHPSSILFREEPDPYSEDEAEIRLLLSKPACFIILGKPGAGKTTLAKLFANEWKCVLLSPAAMIDNQMKKDTPLGQECANLLFGGKAVREELVLRIFKDRMQSPEVQHHGYILDDIPYLPENEDAELSASFSESMDEDWSQTTTGRQIAMLKSWNLQPDFIIHMKISDKDLLKRRQGQKVDPVFGQVYTKEFYQPDIVKKEPQTDEDGDEDEEDEEDEEEETSDTGQEPTVALPKNVVERLVVRVEDMSPRLEYTLQYFNETICDPLCGYEATYGQEQTINLDANLSPTVLLQKLLNRLQCYLIGPAPIVQPLQELQEEEEEVIEEYTNTDSLMRNLSAKRLMAPRFRWRRSRWLNNCPVELFDGKKVPGKAEFAVSFLDKMYCLSDASSLEKFRNNPRPYLLPPQPRMPCKLVILGPPLCGKTTLCYILADKYDAQVVNVKEVIQPRINEERQMLIQQARETATATAIEEVTQQILQPVSQTEVSLGEDGSFISSTTTQEEKVPSQPIVAEAEEENGHREDTEITSTQADTLQVDSVPLISSINLEDSTPQVESGQVPADASQHQLDPNDVVVNTSHPRVEALVKEAVKKAEEKVITLPPETVAEILKEIITKLEEKRHAQRPDAPKFGGWILDDFPIAGDLWEACVEKAIAPDSIILMADESQNGVFLAQRYFGLNRSQVNVIRKARLKREKEKQKRAEELRLQKEEEEREEARRNMAHSPSSEEMGGRQVPLIIPKEHSLENIMEEDEKLSASDTDSDKVPEATREDSNELLMEEEDLLKIATWPELASHREQKTKYEKKLEKINTALYSQEGLQIIDLEVQDKSVEEIAEEAVFQLEKPFNYQGWEYTYLDIEEEEEDKDAELLAMEEEEEEANEESDEDEEDEDSIRNKKKLLGETSYFCPVALKEDGVLAVGNQDYGARYRERSYYLSSPEAREKFLENPLAVLPVDQPPKPPPLRLLILGVRGSGKTTYGRHIAEKLGLFHISFMERLQEILLPKTKTRVVPIIDEYKEEKEEEEEEEEEEEAKEEETKEEETKEEEEAEEEKAKDLEDMMKEEEKEEGKGKEEEKKEDGGQEEEKTEEVKVEEGGKEEQKAEEGRKEEEETKIEEKKVKEKEEEVPKVEMTKEEGKKEETKEEGKTEEGKKEEGKKEEGKKEEGKKEEATKEEDKIDDLRELLDAKVRGKSAAAPIEMDIDAKKEGEEEEEEIELTDDEEAIKQSILTSEGLYPEVLDTIVPDWWKKEPFCSTGFVLEGFPRTAGEIKYLVDNGLFPDTVLILNVSEEDMVGRLLPPWLEKWRQKMERRLMKKATKKEKARKKKEAARQKRKEELLKERAEIAAELEEERTEESLERDSSEEDEEEEEEDDKDDSIELLLDEEFNAEDLMEEEEEEEETEPEALEKMNEELGNVYNDYENQQETLQLALEEHQFHKVEIDAGRKPHIVRYLINKHLKPFTQFRQSLFERVYPLSEKVAGKMLNLGYKHMSRFGRWCPVKLLEGDTLPPYYASPQSPWKSYPCMYRQHIYLLSSPSARDAFLQDPTIYVKQPSPGPRVPITLAIIGPPKSGKTTLAKRFAEDYGVLRLSVGEAMRTLLQTQPKSTLAYQIHYVLCMGKAVPKKLQVHTLERMMLDTQCQGNGYILDGYPMTLRQAELLEERGIVPAVVIYLDMQDEEVLARGALDRTSRSRTPVLHDSQLVLQQKIEAFRFHVGDVLEMYTKQHDNVVTVEPAHSKWWVWNRVLEITKASMLHRQTYLTRCFKGKAASVANLGISPLEFEQKLGQYGQFCPVSLSFGQYVDGSITPSMEFVAEFEGRYYKMAGKKELDKFLSMPEIYVPPRATFMLPKEEFLPKRRLREELQDISAVEFKGYCPVTYLDGKQRYEALEPGNPDLIVEYLEKFYCLATEEKLWQFMRTPEKYSHMRLPHKLPPGKVPMPLTGLPMLGYLEQGVSSALIAALTATGNFKPKYPFQTPTRSALLYTAYHLKAFNPKSSVYMRKKYKQKLRNFEDTCNLIRYLGDNMSAECPEPPKESPELTTKLDMFLALKTIEPTTNWIV